MPTNTSDGHHTFDELYEYRMLYNAHAAHGWLAAGIPVVKSWRHSRGELCFGGGWFIVTATLPTGQVSNHYSAEHWDLFTVPAVDLPPEYDGHTPADAAGRLRDAAVFEQAHSEVLAKLESREQAHREAAPTDDEREDEHQAQMVAFEGAKIDARNAMRHDPHVWHEALEDAMDKVLPAVWHAAAGFRRPEVPEPSTEKLDWPDHWTLNDKLRDLHGRWHDQPGFLLGREACKREGCEFWDAAEFTLRLADVRVIGRETQAEPADPPTVQLMARKGGKTQALIDSMLGQANERGIRVEVVYPQAEPTDAQVDEVAVAICVAMGHTGDRECENDHDAARAALKAAFATNQEENR
ncbi:hypothetical protein PTQ19_10235 [Microbacterium esteraromaticum]|uniref:WDGH domain-containing protein n=1 Tax=Microbacterium esteraromaticum TaxID=57043 RepID=UPI002367F53B|nr:hypothetical protein [Microbacterium esteraromaticum]WDH77899.1 hypothetical protein PTQ19_10235 [Microbacterium esteraromaticum]